MERTTPAVGGARVVSRRRGWREVTLGVAIGVIGASWAGDAVSQEQPAKPAATPTAPAAQPAAPNPEEEKAKLLLQQGKESWEAKNYERVIRKYRQFVTEFPNRPEVTEARYHLALASLEMPSTDWNAVAEELTKVVAANSPNKATANYWLGVAMRVTGEQQPDAAKAKERLTKAAAAFAAAQANGATPEQAARAKVEEAETLIKCGKAAEAVERVKAFAADPALAKSPARPGGLLILGQAQFEAKDYPAAFATLASIAPFDQPVVGIQARYLLGRILEETEQKPEAVIQYDLVAKTYAEEKLRGQRALSDANAWKGKPIERLRTEAMVREMPDFVLEANFRAGSIRVGYGQYAEAVPNLMLIMQVNKWEKKAQAQLLLGICGVQTKKPELTRALQALQEHPQLGDQATWWLGKQQRASGDPANPGQMAQYAQAAIVTFGKAGEKAGALAKTDPAAAARRIEILMDIADTYASIKQFKEAAPVYAIVAKDQSHLDRAEIAHERWAMSLSRQGKSAESDAACKAFLEKYPQSMLRPSVMFWQAENALRQGQKEQAISLYQALIEKYPEFAQAGQARFGLGMAMYAKGDYAKAGKVLSGISPPDRVGDLTAASYFEADCLMRTLPESAGDALSAAKLSKQLEDATGLLSNFVDSGGDRPEMPDAMLKLALCYQRNAAIIADQQAKAALYQGARETYDKLVQRYPRHPAMAQAVMDRAQMLAAMGDAGGAMNELNRFRADATLSKSPVAPSALMKLSEIMVANGRAVDAAAMMEKCRNDFEKEMSNPAMIARMQYHHGVALREAGRLKESLALFEGIIKNWPQSAEAGEASLASIQVRQKETLDKLKAARQAIAAAPADKPIDAKLVTAQQEAMKLGAETAVAFAQHAEKIAKDAEGSDLHIRTLRDAGRTWRAVAEAEIETAQRARAEESVKRLQAKLAAKPPTTGKSNSSPKSPHVKLESIPPQPAEKQAREIYTKALEAAADSPLAGELRLELAELHIQRGEADPAIAMISSAIDQNPPQNVLDQLRIRLGQCYLLKNEPAAADAQAVLCLADTNSPIRPSAYLLKGRALMHVKNWPEAMTVLSRYLNGAEKYRNAGPVTEEGLLALGDACRNGGAWEQSRLAYESMIQRFPNSKWLAEASFGMGMALQQGKQFDRAIAAYTEATRKTSSETAAKAQLQIGLCRAEQKRWQDAVNELLIVPATYDYAEVAANSSLAAAKALVELKQKDQAKEVLKGVVEDHPSTVWAKEAQKRLAEIQ